MQEKLFMTEGKIIIKRKAVERAAKRGCRGKEGIGGYRRLGIGTKRPLKR